jgi:oligopeptidase B
MRLASAFSCFVVLLLPAACGGTHGDSPKQDQNLSGLRPPIAKKVAHPVTMHGDTRQDDYFWIRDQAAFQAWQKDPSKGVVLQDPDVSAYLAAENDYTTKESARTQFLRDTLLKEMKSRVGTGSGLSPPTQLGTHQYYERKDAGQTYAVFYRKPLAGGAEELVLDLNPGAKGHDYYSMRQRFVSPDETMVAYTVDAVGDNVCTLYVRNIATGATTQINNQVSAWYGSAFSAKSDYLFYVTLNGDRRSDKVWRHKMGADPSTDTLAYEEKDDSLYAALRLSRDGQYLFIESSYTAQPTVLVIPANDPTSTPVLVVSNKTHSFHIDHAGDYFYIMTDLDAEDFKVVRAPVATPTPEHWADVIPSNPGTLISEISTFQGYLVALERVQGLYKLAIQNLSTGEKGEVNFDEADYTLDLGYAAAPVQDLNPNFSLGSFRFTYESMVTPRSTREYNFATHAQTVVQTIDVPNYDASRYEEKRVFATAADGAQIPISLVYKKGIALNGKNPLILYGYGNYGLATDVTFGELAHDSTIRISLLDRGVIYGIAHIRGGNEMGQHWFKQGVFMNKKNTFTDFASCLHYLMDHGYTSSDRTGIKSESAGGLLIGYMLNNEPNLFKAALVAAPFVDLINTGADATIPLTTSEYDQWGNPADADQYFYMKSYSPYDNIGAHNYPATLITTGVNDTSVFYWEPTKFTARIRANRTDDNVLLLKISDSGHNGAGSDADGQLKEDAFNYAFLLDQLEPTALKK